MAHASAYSTVRSLACSVFTCSIWVHSLVYPVEYRRPHAVTATTAPKHWHRSARLTRIRPSSSTRACIIEIARDRIVEIYRMISLLRSWNSSHQARQKWKTCVYLSSSTAIDAKWSSSESISGKNLTQIRKLKVKFQLRTALLCVKYLLSKSWCMMHSQVTSWSIKGADFLVIRQNRMRLSDRTSLRPMITQRSSDLIVWLLRRRRSSPSSLAPRVKMSTNCHRSVKSNSRLLK